MRSEIADRLSIDKSTVTEYVKPLITGGILREDVRSEEGRRRSRYLSFAANDTLFAGVNLGVRRSQVGLTTLNGEITDELDFDTPADPDTALGLVRENLAIARSIVGKTKGWTVEAVEAAGSAIGGAFEVAVEEYLTTL